MNFLLAFTHLFVGAVTIGVSIPLIKRKIPMNRWYGIRIPAAFESEQHWFDINEYGGRLLLRWGALVMLVAVPEFFINQIQAAIYALVSAAAITVALGFVLWFIFRHARKTS